MNLDDLRMLVALMIIMFVMFIAMSAGLAHCQGTTLTNDRQLVVMYIKHKNPTLQKETREHIANEIVTQAKVSGIPYQIITAIMCVESCYVSTAVGSEGAIGLMQIYTMVCNGEKLNKELLYSVKYNIAAGICLLLEKLSTANGDIVEAIKRYNGSGPKAEKYRDKVCSLVVDIYNLGVANKPTEHDLCTVEARGIRSVIEYYHANCM